MRKLTLAVALIAAFAATSVTAHAWAPAGSAAIHPGVQAYTEGAQCTTNFVFTDGSANYIGYAAHCAGTGDATSTNGCEAGALPPGTPVELEGSDGQTYVRQLAYSSWHTMQARNESDENACWGNDFALIRLEAGDVNITNPSVPFYGGPSGVTSDLAVGAKAVSYGNSLLRLGLDPLKPKEGIKTGEGDGGWTHNLYTVSPGIPGDSGSGYLRGSDGAAFGVLSTLEILPRAGSNNTTDLTRALSYAATAGFAVSVVPGTEPYSGSVTPG
jgi:hypothetical protein